MAWRVLPHQPIEQLADNLWTVEGNLPHGPMRRVMAVVRLPDGGLVFHSPISLNDSAMRELDAWGTAAFVIVPNDRHRLDAAAFKERYPAIRVVCPAGARTKVEQKIAVDATELAVPTLTYRMIEGTANREGWLEVRHADGSATAVLADLVMNLRPMRGLGGWIMNRMGFTGAAPKISPATRKALVVDPAGVRREVERIATTRGLARVVVAHGTPITDLAALQAVGASLETA